MRNFLAEWASAPVPGTFLGRVLFASQMLVHSPSQLESSSHSCSWRASAQRAREPVRRTQSSGNCLQDVYRRSVSENASECECECECECLCMYCAHWHSLHPLRTWQ